METQSENQLSEYQLIDKEIAESTPCDVCQGQCEYDKVYENGRYIAISRCTRCGHVAEF